VARYGRRRGTPWPILAGVAVVVGALCGWWLLGGGGEEAGAQLADASGAGEVPTLTNARPEVAPLEGLRPEVPERGTADEPAEPGSARGSIRAQALLQSGQAAIQREDLLGARTQLNEALQLAPAGKDAKKLKADLVRLAKESIFSSRVLPDDPYADKYIIQSGDALAKIASSHDISAELLARINKIEDINMIRAGQTIKVLKGPFHARVNKKSYTMDVYLGDLFVKQFKVGLGADDSTPTGKWQVNVKLVNPTYYPPRGGQIIDADDPTNPLGERWIGLVGVDGEALGQQRYGIHGTIEPDSIGRDASLGCIRMFNEDVVFLYDLLVIKDSHVTVER
jgi:lipoprotein-anchoring transpeptidase ErfK/SrfK